MSGRGYIVERFGDYEMRVPYAAEWVYFLEHCKLNATACPKCGAPGGLPCHDMRALRRGDTGTATRSPHLRRLHAAWPGQCRGEQCRCRRGVHK